MHRSLVVGSLLALGLLALPAASPGAAVVTGGGFQRTPYTNPVIDHDFPDPGALAASDGWTYAYATQTPVKGGMVNIQVARSRDLVNWQEIGEALPVKPRWAQHTQNFWAPHVIEANGRFLMYYAAEPDNKKGMALGVAVARSPRGPFVDAGEPMLQSPGFEAIDPMAFDDPRSGKTYLYWGSGFQPIKVRELASDRMHFAAGCVAQDVLKPSKTRPYENLVEGVWVRERAGTYYLFYSGDNCCGDHAYYAVMVARARSPLGPFEKLADALKRPDSTILTAGGRWGAPGHNAIVTDASGQDWLLYHAVDSRQPTITVGPKDTPTRRPLLIDPIVYRDGWPQIEGAHPSSLRRPGPAVAPEGTGPRAPLAGAASTERASRLP